MPINPNIALSYAPSAQLESPMNMMAQIQALRGSRQENALRQAQMQNAMSEIEQRNALLPYQQQEALAKQQEAQSKAKIAETAQLKAQFELARDKFDRQIDLVAPVNNQAQWDAWRGAIIAEAPDYAVQIPEQFSSANKNSVLLTAKDLRQRINAQLQRIETAEGNIGVDPYTGERVGLAYAAPPKTAGTVVNVGGSDTFNKTLGEKAAEQLNTLHTQAQSAQSTLDLSKQLAPLLNNPNFISGTLGDVRLTVAKALGLPGATETQTYFAGIGQQVAERIKAFGAGTGLSDSDRKFAEKIAGGNIELTPAAIRDIVRINEESARRVIKNYKSQRAFLGQKQPAVFDYYPDIEVPTSAGGKALPKVSSVEEARKLPSGTHFLDPNGVERVAP